ncbi:hypothetical protein HT574_17850 [Parageobacillus sp. VR-IP]|uniref:hypothetical protein n=1 Tax=Parageobacillus sp. VR-IP TaxID=2742205 RepID=UPI001581AEDE|nr:hypothetical protein [Parageobacillus sp. VR-IP]NUK31868.1 hypothetical protein [Parageobacillus sp. VR-IP]
MKKIGLTPKKWLLTLHILFAAIMFGVTVTFLVLSIAAAVTTDEGVLKASYTSMHLLAKTSVRASTIGTVVTGVLLSLLTHWGFFRYYWIIVKELLTILSIGIGMVGIYLWSSKAASIASVQGMESLQNPDFLVNRTCLFIGISLQIVSLIAMFILSVFKPWGKRERKSKLSKKH